MEPEKTIQDDNLNPSPPPVPDKNFIIIGLQAGQVLGRGLAMTFPMHLQRIKGIGFKSYHIFNSFKI